MGHEGAPGVFPGQWETSPGAEGQVGKGGRRQGRADLKGWVGVSIIYNLKVNKVNGQKHVRFFFVLATLHGLWISAPQPGVRHTPFLLRFAWVTH